MAFCLSHFLSFKTLLTVSNTEGDSKNQSDLCVERSRANIAESDCKTYKALWDSAASVASGDPVQCIHDLRSENSKLRSMLQAAEDGLQATKRLAISFHDTLLKNGLA